MSKNKSSEISNPSCAVARRNCSRKENTRIPRGCRERAGPKSKKGDKDRPSKQPHRQHISLWGNAKGYWPARRIAPSSAQKKAAWAKRAAGRRGVARAQYNNTQCMPTLVIRSDSQLQPPRLPTIDAPQEFGHGGRGSGEAGEKSVEQVIPQKLLLRRSEQRLISRVAHSLQRDVGKTHVRLITLLCRFRSPLLSGLAHTVETRSRDGAAEKRDSDSAK